MMNNRITIAFVFLVELMVSTSTRADLLHDKQYFSCWQRQLLLWRAGNSISLEYKFSTNHELSINVLKHYVPEGYVKCPEGAADYPPFILKEGPKCPNGHEFGDFNGVDFIELRSLLSGNMPAGIMEKHLTSGPVGIRRMATSGIRMLSKDTSTHVQLLRSKLSDKDPIVRVLALKEAFYWPELLTSNLIINLLQDKAYMVQEASLGLLLKHPEIELQSTSYQKVINLLDDVDCRLEALNLLKERSKLDFGLNKRRWLDWSKGKK